MNIDFDYNIDNYSIKELEKFLMLNNKFTLNDINEKCNKINTIIFESKDYNKNHKTLIHKFLEEAKLKLIK